MLNLQKGRFCKSKICRSVLKIPAKCYAGNKLYVEEQVLNADETVLFYKDVGRMSVASKAPGFKYSKTVNLIICENIC